MERQYILSVDGVRAYEDYLIERGASIEALMELAGTELAVRMHAKYAGSSYLILVGPGNNGGDGWICADELAQRGAEVRIVSAVTAEEIESEFIRERAVQAIKLGLPVFVDPDEEALMELMASSDVIVDALFGIGFHGSSLPEPYARWICCLNTVHYAGCDFPKLVCVDVPSGMNADTGVNCTGGVRDADMTITMFAAKPGFIGGEDAEDVGELHIAEMGGTYLPQDCEDELKSLALCEVLPIGEAYASLELPLISPFADKYGRGTLLIVAGSQLYPGAAVLAAQAAERLTAGYVILAVPQGIAGIIQAQLPTVPVVGLPADTNGAFAAEGASQLANLCSRADAVLAGPGMGTRRGAQVLVETLLKTDVPLVLDADALNCLSIINPNLVDNPSILRREAALILTPHQQELKRLCAKMDRVSAQEAQFEGPALRMFWAQRLAEQVGSHNFALLSKGAYSMVADAERSILCNTLPQLALAKAGTGDVLAGTIASLLASASTAERRDRPCDVSALLLSAQCVHARAAQLYAQETAQRWGLMSAGIGMLAQDLVHYLAPSLHSLAEELGLDYAGSLKDESEGLESHAFALKHRLCFFGDDSVWSLN